jgi:hypothetical protein
MNGSNVRGKRVLLYLVLSDTFVLVLHLDAGECGAVSLDWGRGLGVKRIKGNVVYTALWLTGIISFVLASGAPNKWGPGGGF